MAKVFKKYLEDMHKSKNVVIFGGSGLIGSRICQKLIQKNYKVLNFDKKKNSLVETIIIKNINEKSVRSCVKLAKNKLKKIDILIVCVYPKKFFPHKKNPLDNKSNQYIKDIDDHLGSYIIINLEFIKYFKTKKKGNIINFSSVYGSLLPKFEIYRNTKMHVPLSYVLNKSSINLLTKYLAKYYLKNNIKINTISPGGIFDGQPRNFVKQYSRHCNKENMLKVDDLFSIIDLLILDTSSSITGQNFIIDNGISL